MNFLHLIHIHNIIIIYILIETFTIVINTITRIHYVPACSMIKDYTAISTLSAPEVT